VGWTFLVWGALNGAYQWVGLATGSLWRLAADRFPKVSRSLSLRVLRILLTFHLIAVSWIFFRAKSIDTAWLILKKIALNLTEIPSLLSRFPFTADHYTAFALIALLVVVEIVDERQSIFQRLAQAPVALRWSLCYLAIFGLLILGRWQTREFIYMQF
jgi:D-alanyl-lipoteichoic acid acyltransferase DltB (MBOAT superfamily)